MDRIKLLKYYNYFSTTEFEEAYLYKESDLGAVWTKDRTNFRLWAPTASMVVLQLYQTGDGDDLLESIPMERDEKGTWISEVDCDLNGIYYTYLVTVEEETREAVDPYAKAVGVNGNRGMVVDLLGTDPPGFKEEVKPPFVNPTDAVIYEIHVRDFSTDQSSGINNKGKYLAFTESPTKNSHGDSTGLDHLKDLGITHIHLLPAFDFATVDESEPEEGQYNWGYDPKNYNVPEGFYSTDPFHGEVRIREFKEMVQVLHQNGIRIIMDMVYNHTMESEESNLNRIVPGYYYRLTTEGYFSNASACGNETASEREMVRKLIMDSVIYWAQEYHIDGFRFDLMGIHDIRTMNTIREALNRIDPGILVYGEGWTGGLSPLPDWERALKVNMTRLDAHISAFSDNLRDGIKGSAFSAWERGFVSGREGMEETIKFGVVAATQHNQINYGRVYYSNEPWAAEPTQTINYASAHDNLALWDKLRLSNASDSVEDRIKMNLLSAAILFTCQGIPFFQAGEEFLRSKPKNTEETEFDENSYRSPDFINSLKWDRKSIFPQVYHYYKGMIAFRKAHQLLRMTKTADIKANLRFLEDLEPNMVGYIIESSYNAGLDPIQDNSLCESAAYKEEGNETICVIYNANRTEKTLRIPVGEWKVFVKGMHAGTDVLEVTMGGEITVAPISALVLVK